jgi:glyceraldehyde 3-phosphate dehydrogenase
MAVRVGINGFGRIGRLVLRALHESGRKDIEVVALNDLGAVEANAHLLRYDSVHGRFPGKVRTTRNGINLGRGAIRVLAEPEPAKLPWGKLGVELVLECSGRFAKRELAAAHLDAGAKRVLVSAPTAGADLTVVYGVNHSKLRAKHRVVSNASCTTNCITPVAHVLQKLVGIRHGYMTTIHGYTGDQRLVDTLHSDPHRARAAAVSMIPTSTGAARAVGLVLPELAGKLDGTAIRVPVVNVSLVDFTFVARRKTTADEINQAMTKAAKGALNGVLDINDQPLVSVDFNHSPASSTFDTGGTQVIDGTLCRVLAWYDNEWGFSNRMLDTAAAMGKFK